MNFFVTGGSRGIGAGIVLDAIEHGHDVAFVYRSNKAAAEQVIAKAEALRPGARCVAYQCDVGNADQVTEVADRVIDEFEDIGVVVNCAGINRDNLVISMADEEWLDVINPNLNGPFYVIRAFIANMLANRFGRIINISSIQFNGGSGQANYAASKAGIIGFTKSLARELASRNVLVNAVAPGFIETSMTEVLPEAAKQAMMESIPLGRFGSADDVAGVVSFLASPEAAYVTGQTLTVDGGMVM